VCTPYCSRQFSSTKGAFLSALVETKVGRPSKEMTNVSRVRVSGLQKNLAGRGNSKVEVSNSQSLWASFACEAPSGVSVGSGPQIISPSPSRAAHFSSQAWVPYFASATLCHPSPCLPANIALYETLGGAFAFRLQISARNVGQRFGDASMSPKRGEIYIIVRRE